MSQLYTPRNIFNAGKDSFAAQMKNLQGIGKARAKADKERDELDFQRKEQKLKLEKLRREGRKSEIELDLIESAHKDYYKREKTKIDGKVEQINTVDSDTRKKADQSAKVMEAGTEALRQNPANSISDRVSQGTTSRQLRVSFKNGNVGLESYDPEEESLKREELRLDVRNKRAKANKNDYTRKDVVDLARKFKEEEYLNRDDNDESPAPKIESFMKRAENLLKGGQDSEFDEKTEALITGNIKQYGRSREEVITAMRSKGIIK